MLGEGGRLGSSVGSAEQPHVNLVEKRGAHPGEACELVVVHARATRDVLHLEQVARGVLAAGHDLLGVAAEEDKRLTVGRTLLAVLLGDFVVHVGLSSLGIEHELEADPGKLAGVHGGDGTLEDGHVGHSDAVDESVKHDRRHVLLAREGLRLEAGEVLRRENRRLALLEGLDDGNERFLLHANILSLAKHTDTVQYSPFARRDCCICNEVARRAIVDPSPCVIARRKRGCAWFRCRGRRGRNPCAQGFRGRTHRTCRRWALPRDTRAPWGR